jgi:hypothetical protein
MLCGQHRTEPSRVGFWFVTPQKPVSPLSVQPVKSPVSKPGFTTRFWAWAETAALASTAMKRRIFRFIIRSSLGKCCCRRLALNGPQDCYVASFTVTATSSDQTETTEAPALLKELANIFRENDLRPFAGCVFAFLATLVVCVPLVARSQEETTLKATAPRLPQLL